MTREEALHWLDTIPTIGEQVDALEMAIKALEQEPCEDCISRQDVINAFYIQSDDEGWWTGTVQDVEELLNSLQSTQSKPKTGHWIAVENEEMETIGYYCSECDLPMETENQTRFCPNCGCHMVEPQESIEDSIIEEAEEYEADLDN